MKLKSSAAMALFFVSAVGSAGNVSFAQADCAGLFSSAYEDNRALLGEAPEPRPASYGRFSADAFKELQALRPLGDPRILLRILSGLFPPHFDGWTSIEDKHPSLHVMYREYQYRFNLQSAHGFSSNDPFNPVEYVEALPGKAFLNWIEEIQVDSERVHVLLERDKWGMTYDRGTRYQELTLRLDPSGRVTHVEIRNGDSLLFRRWWKSVVVSIPESAVSPEAALSRDGSYLEDEQVRD